MEKNRVTIFHRNRCTKMKKEVICSFVAMVIVLFISVNLIYKRNHQEKEIYLSTLQSKYLKTNINASLFRLLWKRSLGSSYRGKRSLRSSNRNQNNIEQDCSGVTPGACSDVDISKSSLCPWIIKENYDRFRKPQRIHEAKCLCYSPLLGVDNTYECREIYYDMYVEKARYCEGNKCHYLATTESISVGCVPVVPCTVHV